MGTTNGIGQVIAKLFYKKELIKDIEFSISIRDFENLKMRYRMLYT